jgi:heme-degrading monooxygenase HmoA
MFTIEGRREQLDEFARVGEKKILWALQRFDGFEGLLVLANHKDGQILIVTLWESEEAMSASEEAAMPTTTSTAMKPRMSARAIRRRARSACGWWW